MSDVEVRPLDDREKSVLAPYIPQEDLNRAVLHIGDLPWCAGLAITPSAITRDSDIYIADPNWTSNTPEGIGLIAHELVHVTQYRLGMNWASYLWSVKSGYAKDSEYESPAYALEDRVVKDLYGALAAARAAAARDAAMQFPPPETSGGQITTMSTTDVAGETSSHTVLWALVGVAVCGTAAWFLIPKTLGR